eukprot:1148647-Pelagomonas_calceolata.AAC.1
MLLLCLTSYPYSWDGAAPSCLASCLIKPRAWSGESRSNPTVGSHGQRACYVGGDETKPHMPQGVFSDTQQHPKAIETDCPRSSKAAVQCEESKEATPAHQHTTLHSSLLTQRIATCSEAAMLCMLRNGVVLRGM